MLLKKSVLEKVGGYDTNLGYGEDTDLVKRLEKQDLRHQDVPATEYHTLVTSLTEVYNQGKWYGKSMPQFFSKHPDESLSLASIAFFTILPLSTLLSPLNILFALIALLQYIVVVFYLVSAYIRLRSFYVIGVPLVKVVRSYAELVGVVKGLYTEDMGRN